MWYEREAVPHAATGESSCHITTIAEMVFCRLCVQLVKSHFPSFTPTTRRRERSVELSSVPLPSHMHTAMGRGVAESNKEGEEDMGERGTQT